MPGTCNDCGLAFKADIKAHVAEAHPGLPRLRFRDPEGVNHLVCPDCGDDVVEGGPRHLKPTGPYVAGKAQDPIDIFTPAHSHEPGEEEL